MQIQYSSNATTSTSFVDLDNALEDAIGIIEGCNVPRDTIVCVAELWREAPSAGQVNLPLTLKNSIVQTRSELKVQAGLLMCDLIALADLRIC